MLMSSKYMGRILSAADDDCPAVFQNLTKVWAILRITTRILSREGTRLWVSVFLFKSVVQLVFLFRAETWVVIPCMGWCLRGLQYQVAQQLVGRLPQRRSDRG